MTAPTESTAVATSERKEITTAQLPSIIATSKTARDTIAPFLPEGVSLDRVGASLRVALAKDRAAHAAKRVKNPRLPEESPLERCTPMSVFMAVAKIAQWGLEVGETAHLVPFGTDCTPVADYKGLAQLVIGSGVVRQVEAHCVYAKESFKIKYGTSQELEHHPIGDPSQRGAMVSAYAIFRLRGGLTHFKYMSVEEIEAVRQQYSKMHKEGPLTAWYCEKTVVRHGVKLLPKDPRLAKTLAAFDEIEQAELALAIPPQLQALAAGEPAAEVPAERAHAAPIVEAGYDAPAKPAADPWTLDDDEPATLDI